MSLHQYTNQNLWLISSISTLCTAVVSTLVCLNSSLYDCDSLVVLVVLVHYVLQYSVCLHDSCEFTLRSDVEAADLSLTHHSDKCFSLCSLLFQTGFTQLVQPLRYLIKCLTADGSTSSVIEPKLKGKNENVDIWIMAWGLPSNHFISISLRATLTFPAAAASSQTEGK